MGGRLVRTKTDFIWWKLWTILKNIIIKGVERGNAVLERNINESGKKLIIRRLSKNEKKKLGLVIAEVCPLLQLGLEQMLTGRTEIRLLGTAQNYDDAVQLCQLRQADVLLQQWSIACVERLRLLQTQCPATKVLILISCSDAAQSFSAISEIPKVLAAGAWGAISIDDSIPMMIAAMHAIAQGQRWTSPYLTTSMGSHEPAVKPPVQELKIREQQVLDLMVTGKTDKEIARALNIGERTVRDRLHSIYDKLDAPSRIEAAMEAMPRGLVS